MMKKVLIGIQCRSDSSRLPEKAFLKVGSRSIIEHVVRNCKKSASYINNLGRYHAYARCALLVPENDDKLISHMKAKVDIIEGPKDDVISRYLKAAEIFNADYICRVTGDCLYLPSHTISRHIKYAVQKNGDYVNNILARTNPEGWDTEVLSTRMLQWLDSVAKTPLDREHVTSYIPQAISTDTLPIDFRIYTSTDHLDLSGIKTSIDTSEEYYDAIKEFKVRSQKIEFCERFGRVF